MTRPIREYDAVTVVRLLMTDRPFDGTAGILRAPAVGDVGTVCHEYDSPHPRGPVAVEMVDDRGNTIWLADFEREELALFIPEERGTGPSRGTRGRIP